MTAAERRVLAARLSGPLQSWGEHSPYTHRGTLPYPTYSGLIGLARAALGSGRSADRNDWSWLRELTMAVRIDNPGHVVRDFHTVNPPPAGAWASDARWLSRSSKANQTPYTVPVGGGKAWSIGGGPSTLITERLYLADAVFTWLVDGPADTVDRLGRALTRPRWQLSLGRKACTPDWPLFLGSAAGDVIELAGRLPFADPIVERSRFAADESDVSPDSTHRSADLHIFGATIASTAVIQSVVVHFDDPVGSHPQDGHRPLVRHLISVDAPVSDRAGLLRWAADSLDHS